ncbi:MAG: transglycosylase domain-containing protein, partial [Solirubrobacterales bacterium]|nr:transglycosylase domain-containing protein [Solirubrobacterales bacterium]
MTGDAQTPIKGEAEQDGPATLLGDPESHALGEVGGPTHVAPRHRRWPRRLRLRRRWDEDERRSRPRLRKFRLLALLVGLAALAAISTAFGMMMAVAADLPQLENRQQYRAAANSYLYDDHWRLIGQLAPPNHVVLDSFDQISQSARRAVVAVEDKRFWTEPGVDIRGIARAFVADAAGGARQGASTIAQQFVKNALSQQGNRTVFEKLREAALAYHLTREWTKTKILTEYLNSVYFGNGAYGVESAARVYFGKAHGYDSATAGQTTTGCGDSSPGAPRPSCASQLQPWESALLAGMIANPSAFDPVAHPQAAMQRRNLVLSDMFAQRYLTHQQYEYAIKQPLPTANDIQQPQEPEAAPYFTSWLRPQILSAMGLGHGVPANVAEYRAFYGGLKIRTTLDLKLQQAADQAISGDLPYTGPNSPVASLVAIDNQTGEVRAMVGGPIVNGLEDYNQYPFNIAAEGYRQPGSAFKPFTLAVALQSGFTPDSVFLSAPAEYVVPNSGGKEHFVVHNFGNTYSGPITLAQATAISDNSVFSRLGIEGLGPTGTKRIARMARMMGIRSPISSNYAMILGAMTNGVSPLDMAHAYETFATGGKRVYDPALGAPHEGPTGIAQIYCPIACKHKNLIDKPHYKRVLPADVAQTVHDMLTGVVQGGTGTAAAIPGVDVVGKTGTTSNYGDAWFVGWTPQLTVAVWVGFPNKLVPMATLYNGGPVEGGSFPAEIWHDFMVQALQALASEQPAKKNQPNSTTGQSAYPGSEGLGLTGGS